MNLDKKLIPVTIDLSLQDAESLEWYLRRVVNEGTVAFRRINDSLKNSIERAYDLSYRAEVK